MDTLMSGISSTMDLASSAASTSSIEKIAGQDFSEENDDELLEACKEFEAYFLEQILGDMMDTITQDEDSGSMAQIKNYANEGLYKEYAKMMADSGSIGLADKLYTQIKRTYGEALSEEEVKAKISQIGE